MISRFFSFEGERDMMDSALVCYAKDRGFTSQDGAIRKIFTRMLVLLFDEIAGQQEYFLSRNLSLLVVRNRC